MTRAGSRLPAAWRFLLIAVPAMLLLQGAFRVVFWWSFRGAAPPLEGAALFEAMLLGARFDLRLTLLVLAPMLIASVIPAMDPERSPWARRFWCGHLTFVAMLVMLASIIDLGHYGYLGDRLDASALRFLANPIISAQMVLETYPVVWGALGLAVFAAVTYATLRMVMARTYAVAAPRPGAVRAVVVSALTVVVFLAGIYGKLSWYPLRWSDAYASNHRLAADLALNPVLFFIGSLGVAEPMAYDEDAVLAAYDRVSTYLGVEQPDGATLDFRRRVRPSPLGAMRPNIVIVLLESFSANKLGVLGNPLDPSPRFDAIARESLLYTNFYTPRRGTARGVFATLTGIPDTMTQRTASRNPRAVRQRIMVNAFDGYERFYFLGGSANWANIRGLLSHNIADLRIYEEGSFSSERVDVWGISDLHLFEEANRVLSDVQAPFFALIHCSGNHRPYTIPEDHRGFERRTEDAARLVECGFESEDEFNSFRFMDHAIGFLIEEARDAPYFDNTVFLFFADNGTGGRSPHMHPGEEAHQLSEHHTPLAIYAPGLIGAGRRVDFPASQVDVMATVASLTGSPVTNTTLGRNLFDERFDGSRFALIQPRKGTFPEIGLLDETHLMLVRTDGSDPGLFAYRSVEPMRDLAGEMPEVFEEMKTLGLGLYQTSKWMLYNNAPDAGTGADGGGP